MTQDHTALVSSTFNSTVARQPPRHPKKMRGNTCKWTINYKDKYWSYMGYLHD